jgi:hypothetical protein
MAKRLRIQMSGIKSADLKSGTTKPALDEWGAISVWDIFIEFTPKIRFIDFQCF